MQGRLPKLFPQSTLRNPIHFPLKSILQEQSQPYQIKRVCFFVKIYQNVNIAGFALLFPDKRAEKPDLLYPVSR